MARKVILVVDDDQDALEFVTAILEEEGTEIVPARDGEAGLKAARARRPDLIILDVQMPKKDGFTLFSELRQDDATRGIPVIMLTGIGKRTGVRFTRSAVGDLLGEEPDAYIEKPVDPDALRSAARKLLGG